MSKVWTWEGGLRYNVDVLVILLFLIEDGHHWRVFKYFLCEVLVIWCIQSKYLQSSFAIALHILELILVPQILKMSTNCILEALAVYCWHYDNPICKSVNYVNSRQLWNFGGFGLVNFVIVQQFSSVPSGGIYVWEWLKAFILCLSGFGGVMLNYPKLHWNRS